MHEILSQGEKAGDDAVEVLNPGGRSPVLFVCEHAARDIPARFDGLGLAEPDRDSHAAWDVGALALAQQLAAALDGRLVAGKTSRLVYDCNRPPDAPSAIPARSERIEVPGNRDLSAAARAERVVTVYDPFSTVLAAQVAQAQALVTVHSFTPVFNGAARAVEIGLLHDTDTRLTDAMLQQADLLPHRRIERNAPYGPQDGVTHTLQRHGIANGLPNVMIEVRNDLLQDHTAVERMAGEVLTLLRPALVSMRIDAARPGIDHA